ncbi:HD domain-containing protein [Desulfofalx alkaliphila]|uniref:HD domain-containing protein n=1 Tax=Desulfofalx alkaliphila TaxID=105483 RepID=UPI0004E1E1B6|nr:HD domain-containing protein [Desulfofalx alkaliphila]
MCWIRIKQFISAICSKLNDQDRSFITKILNTKEQDLFYQMDIPTQRHCLNVSYHCLAMLEKSPKIKGPVLIKAALLHDCGKKKGEVKTWHRVVIVLTRRLAPKLAYKLTKYGEKGELGSLGRAFFIQQTHDVRGAQFAQSIGVNDQVVYLIRNHHCKIRNASKELIILQEADSKY